MSATTKKPRFSPGARVMAEIRDTVWTVRSFNPETGIYIVEGNIGGNWPTERAFYEEELWPASLLDGLL